MRIQGTPEEWLSWLTSSDERKRKEVTLTLGGLIPKDRVPIAPLVEALASDNRDLVFWATIGLGCLGPHAATAVAPLSRVAHDHPEFGTRQAAVMALSRIAPSDPTAKVVVLNALDDSNPFVRREALQALIAFEDLSAEELGQIKTMEKDPDEMVARWSEIALRNIRLREMERGRRKLS